MSVNYASGLSAYKNKGRCGGKEVSLICYDWIILGLKFCPKYLDSEKKLRAKCTELCDLIKKSKYCVIHCGAGLSTAAGIPDFRFVFYSNSFLFLFPNCSKNLFVSPNRIALMYSVFSQQRTKWNLDFRKKWS